METDNSEEASEDANFEKDGAEMIIFFIVSR